VRRVVRDGGHVHARAVDGLGQPHSSSDVRGQHQSGHGVQCGQGGHGTR
jgi:hypothetical protein